MTVVSDRLDAGVADAVRIMVTTPEGVPLVFTVALVGERLAAFLIDLVALVLVLLAILLGAQAVVGIAGEIAVAAVLVVTFLLRNGWFTFFEITSRGRTPGKRRAGLRVIDAAGGVLRVESVVVRNLTREVETFLPLAVLSAPELVIAGGPPWLRLVAVGWLLVFALFPLLNRHRRRVGDVLGGTLVVREPRARLEGELGGSSAEHAAGLHFTAEQLAMYGVFELQVLEEVLRHPERRRALADVAQRIRRKIGFPATVSVGDRDFLTAFYRAQRARLERDLLLGRARERKREGRLADGPPPRPPRRE